MADVNIDEIKQAIKLLNNLRKAVKKVDVKSIDDLNSSIEESVTQSKVLKEAIGKVGNSLDKVGSSMKKMAIDRVIDVKKMQAFDARTKDVYKSIRAIKKLKGPLSSEQLQEQIDNLKRMQTQTDRLGMEVQASAMGSAQAFAEMGGGLGQIGGLFKSLSGSPKQMMQTAEAAEKQAEWLKHGVGSLGKMPGLLGMVGKAAKGLGKTLGGISKIFMGWPGIIAGAVVAIGKAITRVDAFVKDANKAFALVRGPDIMTADVQKQFREFNDAIYNMGQNMAAGLNADQIREFMLAVTEAGVRISTLNEGLLSYRDAINVAAKGSRILGMELPMMGRVIGELIADFRMDMETIDESFVKVAFDAQKSGLSTDRFWTAIQNASASLAFYGVFLDAASKSMRSFTESQVAGAKEAAEATEEMTQVFKKNSTDANMAVVQFAKEAGFNFDEAFQNVEDRFKGRVEEIGKDIKTLESQITLDTPKEEAEAINAQIEKLRKEQAAAAAKAGRAADARAKGDIAMAQELAMLTDQSHEVLIDMMKGMLGVKDITKLSGESLENAIRAMEKRGISRELTRTLIEQTRASAERLKLVVGETELHRLSTDRVSELLGTLNKKTSPEDLEEIAKQISEHTGVSMEQARLLTEASKVNEDFRKGLISISTAVSEDEKTAAEGNKAMQELINRTGVAEDIAVSSHKDDQKAADELEKRAEDTFDSIVNQTLSVEDMVKIGKDAAKWRATTFARIDRMSVNLSEIAKKYLETPMEDPYTKKIRETLEETHGELKSQRHQTLTLSSEMRKSVEVQKQISEKQEQLKMLEELGTLQKLKDKVKETKEAYDKSVEKFGENADRTKELKGELDRLIGIQKEFKGEGEKEFSEQKKALKEEIGNQEKQLQKHQDTISRLEQLNSTNRDLSKSLRTFFMSDPEKKKAMFEGFAESLKGVEVGEKSGDVRGELERRWKEYSGMDLLSTDIEKGLELAGFDLKAPTEFSTGKTVIPAKQGLAVPEVVKSPGMVMLHPEEMILPRGFADITTSPMPAMIPPTPTEAPRAGGDRKIEINVSATEKDLAQRIANEVRSVLYQNSLNGMG